MNAYAAFSMGVGVGVFLPLIVRDLRDYREASRVHQARVRILAEEAGVGWGLWTPVWVLKRRIDKVLEAMGQEERTRVFRRALRRCQPPPCRPVEEES